MNEILIADILQAKLIKRLVEIVNKAQSTSTVFHHFTYIIRCCARNQHNIKQLLDEDVFTIFQMIFNRNPSEKIKEDVLETVKVIVLCSNGISKVNG